MDEDKAYGRGEKGPDVNNITRFTFTSTRPKFSASRPPLFPRGKHRNNQAVENKVADYLLAFKGQSSSAEENEVLEYVNNACKGQRFLTKDNKSTRRSRAVSLWDNSWRPEKRMKNIMMDNDVVGKMIVGCSHSALFAKEMDSDATKLVRNHKARGTSPDGVDNSSPPPLCRLRDEYFQGGGVCHKEYLVEMPIDDFREAFLRGMGWETLGSIGLECSGVYGSSEYRTKMPGMTAVETESISNEATNVGKMEPSETGHVGSELLSFSLRETNAQNLVSGSADEKEAETCRNTVIKGKIMSIISGRHLGLRGEVLDSVKLEQVAIMLVESGQKVFVSVKDLADVGSLEEEKVLKQIRRLRIGSDEPSRVADMNSGSIIMDADELTFQGKEEKIMEKGVNRGEGQTKNDTVENESLIFRTMMQDEKWWNLVGDDHSDEKLGHVKTTIGDGRRLKSQGDSGHSSEDMDVEGGRVRSEHAGSSMGHEIGKADNDFRGKTFSWWQANRL